MTYGEAIEYIHGISWTFCKPGLDRIRELTDRLGNPERELKFIHVTGTNGKGSFSSMLSSVLVKAGYRVGLFTSPYILRFNERMKVNGEDISDGELARITERVKPHAEAMADKPTEFELITAIALVFFKESQVQLVILEAGMGGRLDSTNVISESLLSVITGVSLDHTAYLGDTVEKIAVEKAGIIKRGCPVLYGGESGSAEVIIRNRAEELFSPYYSTDRESVVLKSATLSGTVIDYRDYRDIRVSLLGLYQKYNTANVLEAVNILKAEGLNISDEAIREGLSSAAWPARFELIRSEPTVIYDGAHNPEGVTSCVGSIKHYFNGKGVIAISGVLRDKDYPFIASEIAKVATRVYTVTPDSPRALTALEYSDELKKHGCDAVATESLDEAVSLSLCEAARDGRAIICLGSLYTYGDFITSINKYCKEK